MITYYYTVGSGVIDVMKEDEVIFTVASGTILLISYLIGTLSVWTFRAKTDCQLWCISIEDFCHISTSYKKNHLALKTAFLKSISIINIYPL